MTAMELRLLCVQRQQPALVLEQHDALGRGLADHGAVLGPVDGLLRRFRLLHEIALEHHVEQSPNLVVDDRLADLAGLDRFEQSLAHKSRRAGHLQIETGIGHLDGAVGAEPIGDHEALKAPFVAQNLGQGVGIGAGRSRR